MPFDPASDLTGAANYLSTVQKTGAAIGENARKVAAYNALAAAYGPQAGDPDSALKMQEFGQRTSMNPIAVEQAGANLATTTQSNAFNQANDPTRLAQGQATLANTQQSTAFAAQDQPGKLAQQGATLADTRAGISLKGAQAGELGASAANLRATTAKTNIDTAEAQRQMTFNHAMDSVGAIKTVRDAAVAGDNGTAAVGTPGQPGYVPATAATNGAKDGGAAAIAAHLPQLVDTLKAVGMPEDQAQAMARQAATDPSMLDRIQAAGNAQNARILAQKGVPMLSPEALRQQATNFQVTGALPSLGYGGGKTNVGIINEAAALPGGTTGVPTAKLNYASATEFAKDMGDTSPTKLGGQIKSVGAIASHLDLLNQLATATSQGTSGLKAANSVQQSWREQFGQPMPLQFDAQKTLVAGELTKLMANRGDVKMTADFEADLKRTNSLPQLLGVAKTLSTDVGTQLGTWRQMATGFNQSAQFDKLLTPSARSILAGAPASAGGGGAAPAGGGAANYQEGQTLTQGGNTFKVINGTPVFQGAAGK